MEYLVEETITKFHKFVVNDDVDMEKIIDLAKDSTGCDTGYEAVCSVLKWAGIQYSSESDYCGQRIEDISADLL